MAGVDKKGRPIIAIDPEKVLSQHGVLKKLFKWDTYTSYGSPVSWGGQWGHGPGCLCQ